MTTAASATTTTFYFWLTDHFPEFLQLRSGHKSELLQP